MIARQLIPISMFFLYWPLAACSGSEPECSSSDTKDTLRQIIDGKHFKESLSASTGAAKADYSIVDIITTNQESRKASCKASILMSITMNSGETKEVRIPQPFTYTAERTDEGKLFVTANGL